MSVYSEAEHAIALTDTVYWIEHPAMTPVDRYLYGRYHFRLKDYNEAFHWFLLALSDGFKQAWYDIGICLEHVLIDDNIEYIAALASCCSNVATLLSCTTQTTVTALPQHEDHQTIPGTPVIPDDPQAASALCYQQSWAYYSNEPAENPRLPAGESLYRKAMLLRYGLGTDVDLAHAERLFTQVVEMHRNLTPDNYNICCDYSSAGAIDGGTVVSAPIDVCKLPAGAALYELALLELDKQTPDTACVRRLLRNAYDFHYEEALFLDYRLYGADYDAYEYQDEIRELYSYRIGQYTRIHDVNPSPKALDRLARMYEDGYPGDNEERRAAFAQKAVPIRKKIAALQPVQGKNTDT